MMELQYAQITKDSTRDEIRAEIERLKRLANEYKNEEQAIKLTINSIYGGLGNQFFVAHNSDVAEAVTLQGQDLLKYSDMVVNYYFHDMWHLDKELHAHLGIEGEVTPIKTHISVSIYGDTDSLYVAFQDVIDSCKWVGDSVDFILKINDFRLKAYLDNKFEEYAKKWNTVNYQDFELENISEAGIWLAKKKYMLNLIWESGIRIEPLTQIIYKGVELAQSSTPIFARERLLDLIKFIFTRKKELQLRELIGKLKPIKAEFKIAEPEKISMGRSINDYQAYVINDTTALEVAKKIPMQVRAAAVYNYVLNNYEHGKFKGKYELIRSRDKIKYYYAKVERPGDSDVFAFIPGSYPYEFALKIDYDTQFAKTIVDPINRICSVMNIPQISPTLFMAQPLF